MAFRLLLPLLFFASFLHAQLDRPHFTPGTERVKAIDQRQALLDQSLVKAVPFRSVGPSVFSGRVVDIAVNPDDPTHFYVAYASSGLWETTNNGISFRPLFDDQFVMTLGAVAVDWESGTIWLGTGEVNSSRSSYAGAGLYKSTDGGKTWEWKGLAESHHIGRILIDPDNPQRVYVAVLGHLYTPNQERGIYLSTDGGDSWERTLFVNDQAGAVDLIFDPQDAGTLYAAIWERSRSAWNFTESGAGSGIFRSTDNGQNWERLNDRKSGFPANEGVGRIGLAAAVEDGKTIVFAILDNYNRRPPEEEEEITQLTKDELRNMSKADFLDLEVDRLEGYLQRNNFPEKYSADVVRKLVETDEIQPIALVEYIEDANSLLFDTPVIGCEVYRSDDQGNSWKRTHEDYLDDIYFSYGYYFGQIRAWAGNADHLYIMGVPILKSKDGGATWSSINGDNVHVDHHALWVNPERPGHLILGNDGGINISYDDGERWVKCNSPAVGQFYTVAYDYSEPYRIFGGLQDNGVWMGPSTYEASDRWHSTGQYPYKSIMGGDGMQVAVDPRDNNTAYTGFQFGNYFRLQLDGSGRPQRITPKHELGERPLRWNWQTPIHLSEHNPDILYMGSHRLHRSLDQGRTFEAISGDLTRGGKKGDVPYGTLSSIHESPLRFGLLYTGSDDGLVHISRDGGFSWTKISDALPRDMWITRVQASQHAEGRVYVALNGYRWDHFDPYIYVSEDYGQSWSRLGSDLPPEPVNDILEDPVNPDILYVGTDNGLYISLDRGESFMVLGGDLPAVAVHDLALHPRANDLIVGTHGRSIYVANMEETQQLTEEIRAEAIHLFSVDPVRHRSGWGNSWSRWLEPRTPEISIPVFAAEPARAELVITTESGTEVYRKQMPLKSGLHYISYDLSVLAERAELYWQEYREGGSDEDLPPDYEAADNGVYYLLPGKYWINILAGDASDDLLLEIKGE